MYTQLDYLLLALAVIGVSVVATILIVHVLRISGLASTSAVTGERRGNDGRVVIRRHRPF